jgi:hypothetical protein
VLKDARARGVAMATGRLLFAVCVCKKQQYTGWRVHLIGTGAEVKTTLVRGDLDARRQCDVIATARTLINIMCETRRHSPPPPSLRPPSQQIRRPALVQRTWSEVHGFVS